MKMDRHVFIAAAGGLTAFVLDHYTAFMGGIAATATAGYMATKWAVELLKARREFRREFSKVEK